MVKLNMLTGDLIYRMHKTGVHFMHEHIMDEIIKDGFFDLTLSFYRTKKSFLTRYEFPNDKNIHLSFGSVFARILIYFVPVELLFGKHDVYFCDGIVPKTLGKGRKICLIHDLMVYRYPENYSLLLKLYLKWYFKEVKRADRIITVSKATKKDIIRYLNISPSKIDVVYPGFKKSIKESLIDLKIPSKYIFYIGDSRINKNLKGAINGFAKYIERTRDDMYFIIAGGGEKSDLLLEIDRLNISKRVLLLGYVTEEEKNFLYDHSYAFIFVSFFEGFGVPILEAMSRGVPVITSNTSSMKEIAEGYAVLVDPKDYESIYNGIVELSDEHVRKRYTELGYECIQNYGWDRTYQAIKKSINKSLYDN